MASSPPQRLILSPTLVCVTLRSVVAIHLIHLALDVAGQHHAGLVWVTPTPGQGPEHLGLEAHGETVWEQAWPPPSGPAAVRKPVTSLSIQCHPTSTPLNNSLCTCARLRIGNLMVSCIWTIKVFRVHLTLGR